jgi:hypothetical protein
MPGKKHDEPEQSAVRRSARTAEPNRTTRAAREPEAPASTRRDERLKGVERFPRKGDDED